MLLFFCSVLTSSASDPKPKEKVVFEHYAGVQANQLLKQIINLNNNTSTINNPYLLTYSLFNSKCNWGIQTGFGVDYSKSRDEESPVGRQSTVENYFYKAGVGYHFKIGKGFEGIAGVNYVGDYQSNRTFANTVTQLNSQSVDSTFSNSRSEIKTSGAAAEFRLLYRISDRIYLGTETSYTYKSSHDKSNTILESYFISQSDPDQNTVTLSASNSFLSTKTVSFSLPVALFLFIKF